MNLKDKQLYHQIHPLKLFVDFSTAFVSLYFLWIHELIFGLVIAIIPSIITSYLMLNFMDFVRRSTASDADRLPAPGTTQRGFNAVDHSQS